MTICTLSPSPKQYFWEPTTGEPLALGSVTTYAAGTTTPATTYQDYLGATANSNPILLNAFGYATIFLPIASSFKFEVRNALGVLVWTQDNISSVPPSSANLDISGTFGEVVAAGAPVYLSDGSGGKTAGQWFNGSSANAYSSTTSDVGFAVTAQASGSTGSIRIGGMITGLSGLTTGAKYYIGSSGTITSTAPLLAREMGQADSTSTLVIEIGPPSSSVSAVDIGICEFRLSLTTAVPVTSADVTGASAITVYAVPYKGNRIALYDASGNARVYTSAEVSIALPATTATGYDVFGYQSAGVFTLELLAWTNVTTRATALVTNVAVGSKTKSGDATRRYLGSVLTTAVAGQSSDSKRQRFLYNEYYEQPRTLERIETTNSWPYTLAAYQQANASATNQVEIFNGSTERPIALTLNAAASNGAGDVNAGIAIGLDSATVATTHQTGSYFRIMTASLQYGTTVNYTAFPTVGYHYYAWLEKSTASDTTTWISNGSDTLGVQFSGILGQWFC